MEESAIQKLMVSIDSVAHYLANAISGLRALLSNRVRKAIESNAIFILNGGEKLRSIVVGIDGSSNVVASIDPMYVFAVLVTRVTLNTVSNSLTVEYPFSIISIVSDPSGNMYRDVINDVMLICETLALDTALHRDLIVIDGPIIDPPRNVHTLSIDLARRVLGINLDDYHEWRARIIRRIVETGAMVIGVVKRLRGGEALRQLIGLDSICNEELLASMLLNEARKELGCYDCTIVTKPVELNHSLVSAYKRHGIGVSVSYIMFRGCSKAVRVEIAHRCNSKSENSLIQVLKLLDSLTPYGTCVPLPVSLAHEKCRLNRNIVALLRKSISTKLINVTGTDGLSIVDLLGEHS